MITPEQFFDSMIKNKKIFTKDGHEINVQMIDNNSVYGIRFMYKIPKLDEWSYTDDLNNLYTENPKPARERK